MTDLEIRLRAQLPAGPFLVIAPNLQDVLSGMAGTLRRARALGMRLNVLLLAAREDDIAAAEELLCKAGGAEQNAATANGCSVGGLDLIATHEGTPAASPASVQLLSRAVAAIDCRSVFVPSPWSANAACRIAFALLREALSGDERDIATFLFETTRQVPINSLVDISASFEEKRRLLQELQERGLLSGRPEVPLALSQARTVDLPAEVVAAEGFLELDRTRDPTLAGRLQLPAQQPLAAASGLHRLPLVSVVIRTKDRPELLREALASVAGQHYPNIEAVVVNDGGRDIAETVAPFEAALARLAAIQLEQNQGRVHAANLGLKEARGEYLCFLDDDDWFLPDHIAGLMETLRGAPECKAAYAGVRCVRGKNGEWEELHVFNEPFDAIRLAYENYLPMHAVLFHRELTEAGCALDERLDIYEDWDFWIQLSQHTPFAHLDRISAYYRIGAESGFGINGDPAAIRRGLDTLFDKWRRLWTPETLRAVLERARDASRIPGLEENLSAHQQHLRRARGEVGEAANRIRELEHQAERLLTEKQALESAVDQRDARIAAQQKTIVLQEDQSESAKLAGASLRQEKRLLEHRARELEEQLEASRSHIDTLETRVSALQAQAAEREKALEQSQHEAQDANSALKIARESLAQVYASTSWRLTRPIRALRTGVRGPIGGGRVQATPAELRRRLQGFWSRSRHIITQQGLPALSRRALAKAAGRPMISVVVAGEQGRDVQATVQSVVDHSGGYRYEVLVVDTGDGSVPPELAEIRRCRIIRGQRHDARDAWQAAVRRSRADVVVLLRAGVRLEASCLHHLLQTCLARSDAGLVGARLLYTHGGVCAAGGILQKDGGTAMYGHQDNAAKPEYNYVRDAAFLPAGALALTKTAFAAARGRLGEYASWPYRAIDLSNVMHDAGYRVLYQPAAVAFSEHHAMQGADERDQRAFAARWRESERAAALPSGFMPFLARDYGVRGRILVVDYVMITPDQDSGSLRMANMLGVLQELGYKITFVAFNLDYRPPYGAQLQQQGIEVLHAPFTHSIPMYLEEHGADFDIILLSRADIADALIDTSRAAAPSTPIWFDTVDLHFLRELRMAEHEGCELRAKDAQVRMKQELSLVDRADVTLVVSPVEKTLIEEHRPGARVEIVSNIHSIHGSDRPFEKRSGLLFIGGFNHTPNTDAMLYFVDEILPLVRARLGDVDLTIVGSSPPEEVQALGREPGITVTGYVPDVSGFFAQARLSIAPLRYGAGVKGKVNQSMAYGVPVVATSIAVEGMYLEDGRDVLVAEDAAAFADAVARLYTDRALWNLLSRNGMQNLERYFSRRAAREVLERLVREAETAA